MAALADNFHGWRICPGTGELCIETQVIPSIASDEFYRGAIGSQLATPTGLTVANANDTNRTHGIVEKRYTSVNAATIQPVPVWVRGVVWFTGVAAIVIAANTVPIYPLLNSDNPADLTLTGAGNLGALGTVLAMEVTAVSGYVDMTQKAAAANS